MNESIRKKRRRRKIETKGLRSQFYGVHGKGGTGRRELVAVFAGKEDESQQMVIASFGAVE